MSRKDRKIVLQIYSRLDLCDPKALRIRDRGLSVKETEALTIGARFRSDASERLLRFVAEYDGGFYCPEKCDVYEPIREVFNRDDLDDPVRWLSQPFGRVMIKKSRPFRYEGFVENMRLGNTWESGSAQPMSTVRDPLFLSEWCLWIRLKILESKALTEVVQFFKDLYLVSQGDYGFITMQEDHMQKNYHRHVPSGGVFKGDDLECCLPGVYWGNIFGKLYVDWFGQKKFESLPCYDIQQLVDSSFYVQCSDDLDYFDKLNAINYSQNVIDHLGRDAFFDINDPLKSCKVPPQVQEHRSDDDLKGR